MPQPIISHNEVTTKTQTIRIQPDVERKTLDVEVGFTNNRHVVFSSDSRSMAIAYNGVRCNLASHSAREIHYVAAAVLHPNQPRGGP